MFEIDILLPVLSICRLSMASLLLHIFHVAAFLLLENLSRLLEENNSSINGYVIKCSDVIKCKCFVFSKDD